MHPYLTNADIDFIVNTIQKIMKYVVTGGAGFIGSNLVDELVKSMVMKCMLLIIFQLVKKKIVMKMQDIMNIDISNDANLIIINGKNLKKN
jgi:UDP-glucose 4-epimerase